MAEQQALTGQFLVLGTLALGTGVLLLVNSAVESRQTLENISAGFGFTSLLISTYSFYTSYQERRTEGASNTWGARAFRTVADCYVNRSGERQAFASSTP